MFRLSEIVSRKVTADDVQEADARLTEAERIYHDTKADDEKAMRARAFFRARLDAVKQGFTTGEKMPLPRGGVKWTADY